jgi:hypothetical protein
MIKSFAVLLSLAFVAVSVPTLEDASSIEQRDASPAPAPVPEALPEPDASPNSTLVARANNNLVDTIYLMCLARGCNDREMMAMFSTALVESGVQNLSYGDKDSCGIWQQRPSQGWCSDGCSQGPQGCMNVRYSTNSYLDIMLQCSKAHPGMSFGQVAQCCQRSERPTAYDNMERQARNLYNEAKARHGDGGSSSGGGDGGSVNVGGAPSSGGSNNSGSGSCVTTYKVKKGDNCSKIQKMYGLSFSTLRSYNSKINTHCTNLSVNMSLCVKKGSSSSGGSCKHRRTAKHGDTCTKLRGKTSMSAFLKLNPGLHKNCDNIKVGKSYCY